jgi:tRNA (cmo5U34)-methyltransferase
MSEFNQTLWADAAFAREYVEHADHYIPERAQLFQILRSFYRRFLGGRSDAKVCDLGCGDGVLTTELLAEFPLLDATLVDGSTGMLDAARKRCAGKGRLQFTQRSFQALILDSSDWPQFDLVMSGFAIHHLERKERQDLFRVIFEHLREGGYFLNIETALSADSEVTEWYYVLWQEWIDLRSKRLGLKDEFHHVPQKARENPDNKYSPLSEQLQDLESAGFKAVECHYRNGIFSIYTGRK